MKSKTYQVVAYQHDELYTHKYAVIGPHVGPCGKPPFLYLDGRETTIPCRTLSEANYTLLDLQMMYDKATTQEVK